MSGETIKRREARERRRVEALATMPSGISNENKRLWMRMTPKQRSLAMMLAKGGQRLTDAFRIAYGRDASDRRPTVYQDASHAAKNPKVTLMAEALLGEFDQDGLSNAQKTRQYVLEKLAQLSQDEQVSPAVQMQSSVWLGKASHVRLFTEDGSGPQEATGDPRVALAEALQELLSPSPSESPAALQVIEAKAEE